MSLLALSALMAILITGCVIPRSLEVETSDANFSSPPIIDSAAAPFEFPGPFTLARDDIDSTLSLTLLDNDITDTLFVRIFLDYDPESGGGLVTDCTATESGERARVATCPAQNICTQLEEGDTDLHSLEAVVSDRDWLTADDPDAGDQPPLRAVPLEAGRVIRGWSMNCE